MLRAIFDAALIERQFDDGTCSAAPAGTAKGRCTEGIMQETELKLELSRVGCGVAPEEKSVRFVARHAAAEIHLFRPPEGDLAKHGLSLRIRQSGNERIQTIKASDGAAAGAFMREEWERPVVDDTPVVDDPEIPAPLAGTGPRLASLFEVHVKRHRWNVTEGDAAIEVALDIGKVVATDREAPLCEIEFEKKAGPATALFALARKVDLITPAHLGVLSKAERGYRLLGPAPGAVKASPTPLTTDMKAATAFARVAAACLRQFRLNETALSWSTYAEVLHQARVALRRLRSLFSICKPLLHDRRFDQLREELRWLAAKRGRRETLTS